MAKSASNVQMIVLAAVFITVAAGFLSLYQTESGFQQNRTLSNQSGIGNITIPVNYTTTPVETFTEYSNFIAHGRFDEAISLIVVDTGAGYQKPSTHTQSIIKGEMTSVYGEEGKNFEILKLDITDLEPLDGGVVKDKGIDAGYVLSYTMRYNLEGRFGVLSEKATVVGISGQWKVIYPEQK